MGSFAKNLILAAEGGRCTVSASAADGKGAIIKCAKWVDANGRSFLELGYTSVLAEVEKAEYVFLAFRGKRETGRTDRKDMVDRWLGRFLDKLESTGLMQETLLLVLSDHGIALGEHGATGKPFGALWPELTDIPFFIRHPEGVGAGETSDYFASTHDVAPTLLAGVGILPSDQMTGSYLTLALQGGDLEPRDHFTLGYDDFVWARDDRYVMFSKNDRSEPRLFDLQSDPNMDSDIASDNADIVRRMFDDYVLKDAGGALPGQ